MLPLKDNIPSQTRPVITYVILAVNVMVFLYEISLGRALVDFITKYGAIPYYIFHPVGFSSYATLFSSMFMHGNFMHIFGNMLFLWIFADNVEDRLGHFKFIFFYLICGIAGALLHAITAPTSTVPMIGASGAISGVLGAYIILYPKARILSLIFFGFFIRVLYLPAVVFLGIWFAYQFLFGVSTLAARGGGVAYFAHIGGFIAGMLIALPFRKKKRRVEYEIF
ncbi:MAG: rhomboid family intramembrane serine protease [candidate division WOR-3 bacterium]|nr:MAG: rhomboid family intramembrane serine protease [candidate division WOR-3 bacterium]